MGTTAAGMRWLVMGGACLGFCGALLLGCGDKEGSAPDKGKPAAAKAPAAEKKAPAETKALSPGRAWADKVNALHKSTFKDTIAIIEGSAAAEALPKLRAMKEKYVEMLVPLGREREAMDAATRAQAELALLSTMTGMEKDDDFRKYHQLATGPFSALKAKTPEEKEAAAIVTSVNIITQYAHFELLKKQEPKEAERLGIK